MAEQGAKIAATMVQRCHELDPTRVVSAAVNGDNEKGVSDALDIIGFNYNLKLPDGYHKEHPKRPIYGSETSSAISTRGVYATDPLRNTVNAYDGVVPLGRDRRRVVEVLRHARVGGRRLCLDRLRLSRRAHALRLALHQLAVRHRGHVRVSQGQLLLLQGLVGQGARRCICSRTGTGRAGKATRFPSGCTRTSMRSSCSSTARAWAARRFRTSATSNGR